MSAEELVLLRGQVVRLQREARRIREHAIRAALEIATDGCPHAAALALLRVAGIDTAREVDAIDEAERQLAQLEGYETETGEVARG